MSLALSAFLLTTGLFLGMVMFFEIGRRHGRRWLARHPEGLVAGAGAAEGAVFALLGLLIAFSFSGAAVRFESRRHLITEETNAIGTAWLRIDLLSAETQPGVRDLFRRYLDTRLETYRRGATDLTAISTLRAEDRALQSEIWAKASAACLQPETPAQAAILLLPALNAMIDITTTREMATRNHPPNIVFYLLGGLSLISALLVGYSTSVNQERTWFHTLVFSGIMSVAVYVIVDLEYPRRGLIRIDAADQVLVDLRKSMQ